jgi:probable HAF family extracellular repeat protein
MPHRAIPMSAVTLLMLAILGCDAEAPLTSAPGDSALRLSSAPKVEVRSTTSVGTFGLDHGFGFEINDSGEIAGRSDLGSPTTPAVTHAVFWSPRTGVTDLNTLGGVSSETRGLSNHGLVAGFAQKPGDSVFQHHPTVWKVGPGGVDTIELGPFVQGQAEDANDQGLVVGWSASTVSGPPTAFRWSEREGISSLPLLGGGASRALGVNGAGDIAGTSTVAPPFFLHAVVWWKRGTVTDIGSMGGNTEARGINDVGEVVGNGRSCGGCPPHAFYWSQGTGIVDLGTFGGVQSFAFDIDNQGRVTGIYDTADGVRHGFLWTAATGGIDLPTLGGALSATGGINSRGQATGRAEDASGTVHAVIWQLGP